MKYCALSLLTILLFSCNPRKAKTRCKTDKKGLDPFAYIFLPIAGSHGIMEIEMGKLAKSKSFKSDILEFADSMIAQHTEAQLKYQKLMNDKGLTYPTKMQPDAQHLYDSLSLASKDSFDQKYADMMIADHSLGMGLFDSALKCPIDTAYVSWLREMKSVVTMHYEMAMKLGEHSNGKNGMQQH